MMAVGFRTSIAKFYVTFFSSLCVMQVKEGPYIYENIVNPYPANVENMVSF